MKKIILILVISLAFSFAGCAKKENKVVNENENTSTDIPISNIPASNQDETVENTPSKSDETSTDTKKSEVKEITGEEALELCRENLSSHDETTGFDIGYMYEDTGVIDGAVYHVIRRSWYVDEGNPAMAHWSTIGFAMVSINGDVIYDGYVEYQDGDRDKPVCSKSDILWQRK